MSSMEQMFVTREQQIAEARSAEYLKLRRLDKPTLLAIFGRYQRVNSANLKTSKDELIGAILDCTHPFPRRPRTRG